MTTSVLEALFLGSALCKESRTEKISTKTWSKIH